MTKRNLIILIIIQLIMTACSSVKLPVTNQYTLTAFSHKVFVAKSRNYSILVTMPEAVAGYQTEQMLYMKKPFELSPFANNAWVDQPANILFPLIVQSLQSSGYFYAVASSPHAESTDYRLDTQLIALEQNFLKNPSVLDLVVKIVLTNVGENRVVASKVISQHIPCTMSSPYGGVLAANVAAINFTAATTSFVVRHIQKDSHHPNTEQNLSHTEKITHK